MRSQNHRLCIWFILTLASPGAVTWEVNIIVFVCGLDKPSLHRELLHEKSKSSSLYVVYTNPRFTGSYYMRSQHHCLTGSCYMRNQRNRLCMSYYPNLTSLGTVTWEDNIIIFACDLDHTSLHRELLYEKTPSSSLHMVYTKPPVTGNCYMRRQHHRLCMWFRPNLASPGTATWEVNIIVFVYGLDETSLYRELLH